MHETLVCYDIFKNTVIYFGMYIFVNIIYVMNGFFSVICFVVRSAGSDHVGMATWHLFFQMEFWIHL